MIYAPALLCLVLASIGCLYVAYAAFVAAAFAKDPAPKSPASTPVTILKPLKGVEPALLGNLASFCAQDYPGPVQIVFGVQSPKDNAIAVVHRLQADFPDRDISLVVDVTTHGTNPKIANIINMMSEARHDCLILSDSDIEAPGDYLQRIAAALAESGVGGVTCLYYGVAVAGFWSQIAALEIDTHFLPNALVGLRSGLATPCFGSTIALRRDELQAIGGFQAFSNVLADDHAIGSALRARNSKIAIPRFLVGHSCADNSLSEVWRHELRWARTIRTIDPWGYAGSIITHPLAFALLTSSLGMPGAGLGFAALAIACRIVLLRVIARSHGLASPLFWLVPARDLLSFAVFAWSFFGRDLTWRGQKYRVRPNGVLTAD